jgi:hypothetical protein
MDNAEIKGFAHSMSKLDVLLRNPRAAYGFVGVMSVLVWIWVLGHDVPTLISRFAVDDTFYYLEIARNIAAGNGVTFDGIHRTNGFQPLFQLLLVPIFWLTTDSVTGLYLLKGLEVLILGIVSVLLFRFAWKFTDDVVPAWFALALFYLPSPNGLPFSKDLMIGMESGLNALMNLLLLNLLLEVWNVRAVTVRRYILYGAVIGFTFLARLDSIFLILGILLLHILEIISSDKKTVLFKNLSQAGLISLLIAGTYILWNLTQFGHLMPISGRVLAWNSSQTSNALLSQGIWYWLENTLWFFTKNKAVGMLVMASFGIIPLILIINRFASTKVFHLFPQKHTPLLKLLWAVVIVKALYYAVFEQFPVSSRFWYYVLDVLIFAVGGGVLLSYVLRVMRWQNRVRWSFLVALVFMTISSMLVLRTKAIQEWEYVSYMELKTISEITGPQVVLGVKDAGALGYFLPNPVINLDGLVNDNEFFEDYWKQGRFGEYILKEDIVYLVNLLEPGDADLFSRALGPDHLALLYRSSISPIQDNRVYKIYRVLE